jgi:hypothetical protein
MDQPAVEVDPMSDPDVSPTRAVEQSHSPGGPEVRRSIPVGWVVAVIAGALISLIAIGPLIGGGFLLWANATQRDDSGFFTTSSQRFETTSYAITSEKIDLGANPADRDTGVDLGDIATLRLDVAGTGESPTFVGIGPTTDVVRYLNGVASAQVDDIRFDPFAVDYRYREGGPPPSPPSRQGFWVASVEGTNDQSLVWEPESGNWSVVIMNANASAGVSVDASLGVKTPWVFRVGIALVVGGALGLLLGATLLVVGVLGLARGSHIDLTGTERPAGRPVQLEGRLDQPLNRWLWLVKWLLLVPHFIVLAVLWIAFSLVTFVAFFAILFTERYPKALFDFNAGVLRWTWRVTYYGYSALGTDSYPPFSMGAEPDYPATLTIARPERLSRGLVLVKWWLLAIPQYLVLGIIGGGLLVGFGGSWRTGIPFGGFLGLLVLFAAVALLFTGQYPRGMFDLVMGLNRWVYRVVTYVALMRDEYPPFRLDQGGSEPAPDGPPSVPPPTETARPEAEVVA